MTFEEYIDIVKQIARIDDKLKMMGIKQTAPRIPTLSDMPRGGNGDFDQFGNYMIRVEALYEEREKLFDQIRDVLTNMEYQLVYYRYGRRLTWKETAMKIGYQQRNVYNIHDKIMQKFE